MVHQEVAANPERGEVEFISGDRRYALRLRTNAICALQKRTGKSYGELLAGLGRLDVAEVRELFFAALQPYHAKEIDTLDKAGDLIDDAGGHALALRAFLQLLDLNKPPAKNELAAPGGETNPLGAQVGTGDGSGSMPDASA